MEIEMGNKMETEMGNNFSSEITFFLPDNQEMLRIASDGFYVRGKKLPQDENEARLVYEAICTFLQQVNHPDKMARHDPKMHLHTHPQMERDCNVPDGHVIIDKHVFYELLGIHGQHLDDDPNLKEKNAASVAITPFSMLAIS